MNPEDEEEDEDEDEDEGEEEEEEEDDDDDDGGAGVPQQPFHSAVFCMSGKLSDTVAVSHARKTRVRPLEQLTTARSSAELELQNPARRRQGVQVCGECGLS